MALALPTLELEGEPETWTTPGGLLRYELPSRLGRPLTGEIAHHLTVDVEEYFQVSALERAVPRAFWSNFESRVEASVQVLMDLMMRRRATGTFFVLGCVAERLPRLVRAIAAAGHEVASHGWDHRRVPAQSVGEFRSSVRRTKRLLEDLTGTPVAGFRAPSFSICPGHEWALDVLLEEGYRYDSSLFPVRRPGYGYRGAPQRPYLIHRAAGRLLELPPATLRRFGMNVPAGGGAYLRLFPLPLIRAAVNQMEDAGFPSTLYVHPWELDPDQPRVRVSALTRVRHYGGLERTRGRLDRLLSEFRFLPIAATLARA